ncbi:M23 family metallopeptidase [Sandaracinobacter sp. RS1-74]|uniref:peptidoglycan DD-metalloendopeptidase family protein n=1 Tax=Sandaracinobacteroides sayramensis TaxID=2913411 RepID=UPI001EDC8D32|nr:peptidoglycan DD-metalloendopeptidase family protein [Sandaracinobacteroides sayramensis]MCG2842751.1 M23 family metallopeptidase [Sandaracinobacteroides sayramensis]
MATLADLALAGAPAQARDKPSRKGRHREMLARSGAALHRTATGIAEAEILVDLGDSIGSGRWWRGAATLAALIGAAVTIGGRTPTLVGHVPATPSMAELEERQIGAISSLAGGSETGRRAAPTAMAKRLSETPERPRIELTAKVGSGGLEAALRRSGLGKADLDRIRSLLSGVVSGSGVKPGTDLKMVLGRRESRADPRPLEHLAFRATFDSKVEFSRGADGELKLKRIPIRIDNTPLRVTGVVGTSLDRAARAAGIPAHIVAEYRRQMSYAIDLQRDIGRRDRFEIIVANRRAETGESEMGGLLYAGLINGRSNVSLMRWGNKGEFFWQNGEAVKKGLIRSPVSGARLSSGFGMRFHPVLGYGRMHKGVDFAARTGTPIQASASGTVVMAGWGGGYGNVVVIDHGRGLRTRYAHMHRIGVKNGQQVSQGQTIGQVGSTGLSTGPHLHYEVWQNGVAVDPRQARFMGGTQLGGGDLRQFKGEMARLKALPAAGGVS